MVLGKEREDSMQLPGLGFRELLQNGLPWNVKILLAAAAAVAHPFSFGLASI